MSDHVCVCTKSLITNVRSDHITSHHIVSYHIISSLYTSKSTSCAAHKAAAEVSIMGHHRRGELLRRMDGRANPLMTRKVVRVVLLGVVAVVISPTTAGYSVV